MLVSNLKKSSKLKGEFPSSQVLSLGRACRFHKLPPTWDHWVSARSNSGLNKHLPSIAGFPEAVEGHQRGFCSGENECSPWGKRILPGKKNTPWEKEYSRKIETPLLYKET